MSQTRFASLLGLCIFSLALLSTADARKSAMVTAKSWIVGDFIGDPNESQESFLFRLASFMQKWTNKNNAEACGYLAKTKDGQWGVRLLTQKSQIMCIMSPDFRPDQMTATALHIHSHPDRSQSGRITLTPETLAAAKAVKDNRYDNRYGKVTITAPRGPSKDDLQNPPGYVVDTGRLLYHAKGKVSDLGAVPK